MLETLNYEVEMSSLSLSAPTKVLKFSNLSFLKIEIKENLENPLLHLIIKASTLQLINFFLTNYLYRECLFQSFYVVNAWQRGRK